MSPKELAEAVNKRRTFAIISHPDAGKTTITEQLLLFGGVVREAGTVKARKTGNFAKSDWMEIEKKRGISVTSSVMQFDFQGKRINILDTPGHEDFSEDTYRTLMAVDSAVMVIDSAKGIEPQTKKLFQICKMRGIPIFTFMNKFDRDAREPLDLLNEVEDVLGIETYPINWPIGSGHQFKGIYDRFNHRVALTHPADENNPYLPLDEDGNVKGENPLAGDGECNEYVFVIGVWIQFDYCFKAGVERQETADLADLAAINFRRDFRSTVVILDSIDNFQESCSILYYVCGSYGSCPKHAAKNGRR